MSISRGQRAYNTAMAANYIHDDDGIAVASTDADFVDPNWWWIKRTYWDDDARDRIVEVSGSGTCKWYNFTLAFEYFDASVDDEEDKDILASVISMLINGMKFNPHFPVYWGTCSHGVRVSRPISDFFQTFFSGFEIDERMALGGWVRNTEGADVLADDVNTTCSDVTQDSELDFMALAYDIESVMGDPEGFDDISVIDLTLDED